MKTVSEQCPGLWQCAQQKIKTVENCSLHVVDVLDENVTYGIAKKLFFSRDGLKLANIPANGDIFVL